MTDAQRIEDLEKQVKALWRAVDDLAQASTLHSTALGAINGSIKLLGHLEDEPCPKPS